MSISFQEDGICVAHVMRSPSVKPVVGSIAFYPGDILPKEGLLERLSKELQANRYQCTTLLAAGEYQLLSVEAPNVLPDELKTAIRWRLKDMLDFHIDDATIDVFGVPGDKNAPVRNHSMYAVAARNQLIQQRQALCEQAKIPLTVIDIPEMAQRNISTLIESSERAIAFLSFDAHGGLLTVAFSGELYLSRRIDVRLSQLRQSDTDQRNAYYQRIALELQRSLDHFDRQYHFVSVSRLVLAPSGESEADLQAYLAGHLYIPVESFDVAEVFDISKVPELKRPEVQQRYLMALGAGLRHEEKAL